jgi:hypothetical protein
MKCIGCDVDYPPDMLNRMELNGTTTEPLCGPCALAVGNAYHGISRTKFLGPKAEAFRQQALKHRADTGQVPKQKF